MGIKKGFFLGIAAGIMIGIGGAVLLACDNKYVGAVMFSVALLTICTQGLFLFTGRIGYIVNEHTKSDILMTLFCIIGNAVGTGLSAGAVYLGNKGAAEVARAMCEAKLDKSIAAAFFSAVLCGILMYVAVNIYKSNKSYLGILFCVPVFILSGFEHSIADMFYFWVAGAWSLKAVAFIGIVIVGNAVGGCLLPVVKRITD